MMWCSYGLFTIESVLYKDRLKSFNFHSLQDEGYEIIRFYDWMSGFNKILVVGEAFMKRDNGFKLGKLRFNR